jgi:hypothetical protein
LGLTQMCDAVETVGIAVGCVRKHLGQSAVEVKRVGGVSAIAIAIAIAIEYALQAVAESVVAVLVGVCAAHYLGQPDGNLIAFQTNRDGNWEIYVVKTNGSALVNLTQNPADDQMPYWQK